MVSTRAAQLAKKAAARGWRLERNSAAGMQPTGRGYRLVDAHTGTMVAGDWTRSDGFGLSLDSVEDVLSGAT